MQTEPTTSFTVAFSRLFWMMLGPLILFVLAYSIVRTGNGWATAADLAYLGVLAGLVVARWLEFRAGHPQTSTGEPATPGHLRRYVVAAFAVGLGVWVVANLVANHWLAS